MVKPFNGDFEITQVFGINPQNYAQFGLKGHNGIDYKLPTGTKVLAPHGGKIIEATLDPAGYGLYVKIENDIEGSVLAHFKELRVGVGEIVNEGQLVGLSNSSGNSTGPHLHVGYFRFPRNRQNGFNGFIDQTPYLEDNSQTDALKECLFQHEKLVTEAGEKNKEINQLKIDKNTLEKKLELLQIEMTNRLAKKDLECEGKIKAQETSMSKTFDLKEQEYKKAIEVLEEKLKEKEIIVEKEPIKPETFKEKLMAIIEIIF